MDALGKNNIMRTLVRKKHNAHGWFYLNCKKQNLYWFYCFLFIGLEGFFNWKYASWLQLQLSMMIWFKPWRLKHLLVLFASCISLEGFFNWKYASCLQLQLSMVIGFKPWRLVWLTLITKISKKKIYIYILNYAHSPK